MKQVLTNFNGLLMRNNTICIVSVHDRTEWVISPKKTVEEFIKAIETVCDEVEGGTSEVRTAEDFDSGYSVEITVRWRTGDNDGSTTMYLYHANRF